MVSSSCLFYAFSEIILPKRSLLEGEKLQQKETRKEQGKAKKLRLKPKSGGHHYKHATTTYFCHNVFISDLFFIMVQTRICFPLLMHALVG